MQADRSCVEALSLQLTSLDERILELQISGSNSGKGGGRACCECHRPRKRTSLAKMEFKDFKGAGQLSRRAVLSWFGVVHQLQMSIQLACVRDIGQEIAEILFIYVYY